MARPSLKTGDATFWSEPTDATDSIYSPVNSHRVIDASSNNNIIELNDLTSLCTLSQSNHSSGTGSTVSLNGDMNINGSTKILNGDPTLGLDEELLNILTLNNHKVGKNCHRSKHYMNILPPMHTQRSLEERDTSDKCALLGRSTAWSKK